MEKNLKILGISGSPRKGSNTSILVKAALEGARSVDNIETEFIGFYGKKINPCVACYKCPVEGTYCIQQDSMTDIYPRLFQADGIILGAPVYFGSVNAQTKAFMDRCKAFGATEKSLEFKVGGALAVGGGRHSGQEFAIQAIRTFFIMSKMIQVGSITGPIGVAGLAWKEGKMEEDVWISEIRGKQSTMDVAKELGKLVAVVTKIVDAGKKAVPYQKYNLMRVIPEDPASQE